MNDEKMVVHPILINLLVLLLGLLVIFFIGEFFISSSLSQARDILPETLINSVNVARTAIIWIIAGIILLVFVFIAFFGFKKKEKKTEMPRIEPKKQEILNKIKDLQEQLKHIEQLKNSAEQEYYHGKMAPMEFESLTQNYQHQYIQIKVQLNELKKNL